MRIDEALSSNPKELQVVFETGSILTITYVPADYTVAELEEMVRSERDPGRIIEAIRRIVRNWDLQDRNGNVIPLEPPAPVVSEVYIQADDGLIVPGGGTAETPGDDPLRHVPTPLFRRILEAVNEDQSPGEAKRRR